MLVSGYFFLRQREDALQTTMREQMLAHAHTLRVALENHYSGERLMDVHQLINALSDNPKLYRATLFDENGRLVASTSNVPGQTLLYDTEVKEVIRTGETKEHLQRAGNAEYFAIIMPVDLGAGRRGAFEIAQPTTFVKAEIAQARRNYMLVFLVIVVVIFVVVYGVLRFGLQRPIKALLHGTAEIGRGNLDYRVAVSQRGGEFAQLAEDFNHMAEQLAEQRSTAAHEAEQKLSLERELRHRDRLVIVGRIAASVAHEMGTPLNVIDGRAAQLLSRPDAPPEIRQRNLTIIRDQAVRITRVVRQLLHLAHPHELRRKSLKLDRIVADTLELIEAEAARAGVEIKLTPGKRAFVSADQDLLHQVLLNICLNAIQAMPSGGQLSIECVRDGAIRDSSQFAAVSISDTGSGIAAEHIERIFEPFFTTKDVGEGTGLGLAVSRRIIEEHGGWIEVVNGPEGGAVFTVFLPRAEEGAERAADATGVERGS
jgi:signal transduction histidine kinase